MTMKIYTILLLKKSTPDELSLLYQQSWTKSGMGHLKSTYMCVCEDQVSTNIWTYSACNLMDIWLISPGTNEDHRAQWDHMQRLQRDQRVREWIHGNLS